MAQGVIAGAAVGLLVSGIGVAAVSLAVPVPSDAPSEVVAVREGAEVGPEAPLEVIVADPVDVVTASPEPEVQAEVATLPLVPDEAAENPPETEAESVTVLEVPIETVSAEPPVEVVAAEAIPDAPELTVVLPDLPEAEEDDTPEGGRFEVAIPALAAQPPDAPDTPSGLPDPMEVPEPLPEADPPEVAVDAPEEPDLAQLAPEPPEGPAIEVGAIDFAPTARPMLGIVLLDTGDLPELRLVSGLPFPISVVIDPLVPDAAERMAFWRGVGAEVALSGALPGGATAQDAAQAIEAWRQAVPWAVAAVEADPGALGAGRGTQAQLLDDLAESGHGLLVHSRGLNTARDDAVRAGVPAGVIFRDIDGAGETPAIIRRFLDQAAFRASRNDGVILLGRTDPETIETIRDWSVGKRGQTVAIAPLSVMLPRDQ